MGSSQALLPQADQSLFCLYLDSKVPGETKKSGDCSQGSVAPTPRITQDYGQGPILSAQRGLREVKGHSLRE